MSLSCAFVRPKVSLVAPAKGFVPSKNHWQANGADPVATTLKPAELPATTVWLVESRTMPPKFTVANI